MTTHFRRVMRPIGVVLVLSFFLMEVAQAAPLDRAPEIVSPIEMISRDPMRFEAPMDFTTLREAHKGNRDILIIHIQDPHSNVSGQQNLANALDEIMTKYGVTLVLSEGGAQDCSLTPLKKIAPAHVWKRIAKSYLMEGKITGEEYLNLVSDHPMKIMGLEDIMLYLKSVQNYADLADKREEILEYLKTTSAALSKVKRKLYPPELVSYEEKKKKSGSAMAFEAGFRDLMELAHAKGVDLAEFPNAVKLVELQLQEKLIDFNLANLEQASLVEEISKKGGGEDLKAFLEKRERMKDYKVSQYAYFQKTFDSALEKGISLKRYPNLVRYGEYLKNFSEIDLDALLDELAQAEDKVYLALLSENDARLIRAIDRFVQLLHTAYQIQMTTKEFGLFKANEPDFATVPYLAFINRKLAELGYYEDLIPYKDLLEKGKASLEAFYDSVTQRDFAFMENAERILQAEGQKVAVLITGGYHTPHLKTLSREKGFSMVVLTPIVTSETNQEKYEKLLISPIRPEVKRVEMTQGGRRADRSLSALDSDLVRRKKEGVRQALARAGGAEYAGKLTPEDVAILKIFRDSKTQDFRAILTDVIREQVTGEKAVERRVSEVMEQLTQGARLAVRPLLNADRFSQLASQMETLMGEKMTPGLRDAVVRTLESPDNNASLLYYSNEGKLTGFMIASKDAQVKHGGETKRGAAIVLEAYGDSTAQDVLLDQLSRQAPAADVYRENFRTGEAALIGKADTLRNPALQDLLEEAEEGSDVVDFMTKQMEDHARFVQGVLSSWRKWSKETLSRLRDALLDHEMLAAFRRGVKAGDRIVVFSYRNLKGNNKKLGYFGNNRVIAAMREKQLDLMLEAGLLSAEQGALARNAKLHKMVVKSERGLTDQELTRKLEAVSKKFTDSMKVRFPREEVYVDIGFSKPVAEEESPDSDDMKLAADAEALQAAKIARQGNERGILETSVTGFNDSQFETILQRGGELSQTLGLNGIQGATPAAIMATREKREGDLPEYIKYHVDLFDFPIPLRYSQAEFNRWRRDGILEIIKTLDEAISGRAPPGLAGDVTRALNILKKSVKDPLFTNGADFPAEIVNSKGSLIVADKSNFYAMTMKEADKAYQEYLTRSPGLSETQKRKLRLRLMMEADDRVKDSLEESRDGLVNALKQAGAEVRFGNIDGGDEIILFTDTLSDKAIEALRGTLGGLGLRIVAKEYTPDAGGYKTLAQVLNRASRDLDDELRKEMGTGRRAFVHERTDETTGLLDTRFIDFAPARGARLAQISLNPASFNEYRSSIEALIEKQTGRKPSLEDMDRIRTALFREEVEGTKLSKLVLDLQGDLVGFQAVSWGQGGVLYATTVAEDAAKEVLYAGLQEAAQGREIREEALDLGAVAGTPIAYGEMLAPAAPSARAAPPRQAPARPILAAEKTPEAPRSLLERVALAFRPHAPRVVGRALSRYLDHKERQRKEAKGRTYSRDVPEGFVRIRLRLDAQTLTTLRMGDGYLTVLFPEEKKLVRIHSSQFDLSRLVDFEEKLRIDDRESLRAAWFPDKYGSWKDVGSQYRSLGEGEYQRATQAARDSSAKGDQDWRLANELRQISLIYQKEEREPARAEAAAAGARLSAAARLDAAGFRPISGGLSRGEADRVLQALGRDANSGYSQVAGGAFLIAAPSKVKIGRQEVTRPAVQSVKVDERQRKRGAHGELFLALAEAMKEQNMANAFWEIAVTPEAENQLEIAKSLGFLYKGQPIGDVQKFLQTHRGEKVQFAVQREALLKNAQAITTETDNKRNFMLAFGADAAEREAMLELDWPVVRDGLRYLWFRDPDLPRNIESLNRISPLIALEHEARRSEIRARTMDLNISALEKTTTPLTPVDKDNLKRFKDTAQKERKNAVAKRNQALMELLDYRNELGISVAPAAPSAGDELDALRLETDNELQKVEKLLSVAERARDEKWQTDSTDLSSALVRLQFRLLALSPAYANDARYGRLGGELQDGVGRLSRTTLLPTEQDMESARLRDEREHRRSLARTLMESQEKLSDRIRPRDIGGVAEAPTFWNKVWNDFNEELFVRAGISPEAQARVFRNLLTAVDPDNKKWLKGETEREQAAHFKELYQAAIRREAAMQKFLESYGEKIDTRHYAELSKYSLETLQQRFDWIEAANEGAIFAVSLTPSAVRRIARDGNKAKGSLMWENYRQFLQRQSEAVPLEGPEAEAAELAAVAGARLAVAAAQALDEIDPAAIKMHELTGLARGGMTQVWNYKFDPDVVVYTPIDWDAAGKIRKLRREGAYKDILNFLADIGSFVAQEQIYQHAGADGHLAVKGTAGNRATFESITRILERSAKLNEKDYKKLDADLAALEGHLDKNRPILMAERLEGRTLEGVIRDGSVPLQSRLDYFMQAAHLLDNLHQKGIVHGDIKAANIWVTPEGEVRLIDFGIARVDVGKLRPEDRRAFETHGRFYEAQKDLGNVVDLVGTPTHMPETLEWGDEESPSRDIYALGMTLAEIFNVALTPEDTGSQDLIDLVIDNAGNLDPDTAGLLKEMIRPRLGDVTIDLPEVIETAEAIRSSIAAGARLAMTRRELLFKALVLGGAAIAFRGEAGGVEPARQEEKIPTRDEEFQKQAEVMLFVSEANYAKTVDRSEKEKAGIRFQPYDEYIRSIRSDVELQKGLAGALKYLAQNFPPRLYLDVVQGSVVTLVVDQPQWGRAIGERSVILGRQFLEEYRTSGTLVKELTQMLVHEGGVHNVHSLEGTLRPGLSNPIIRAYEEFTSYLAERYVMLAAHSAEEIETELFILRHISDGGFQGIVARYVGYIVGGGFILNDERRLFAAGKLEAETLGHREMDRIQVLLDIEKKHPGEHVEFLGLFPSDGENGQRFSVEYKVGNRYFRREITEPVRRSENAIKMSEEYLGYARPKIGESIVIENVAADSLFERHIRGSLNKPLKEKMDRELYEVLREFRENVLKHPKSPLKSPATDLLEGVIERALKMSKTAGARLAADTTVARERDTALALGLIGKIQRQNLQPIGVGATAVSYYVDGVIVKISRTTLIGHPASKLPSVDTQRQAEEKLRESGNLAETAHLRVTLPFALRLDTGDIDRLTNQLLPPLEWRQGDTLDVDLQETVKVMNARKLDRLEEQDAATREEYGKVLDALADYVRNALWGRLRIFNFDLKPANVGYLYENGRVVIKEFDTGMMDSLPEGLENIRGYLTDTHGGKFVPVGYEFARILFANPKLAQKFYAELIAVSPVTRNVRDPAAVVRAMFLDARTKMRAFQSAKRAQGQEATVDEMRGELRWALATHPDHFVLEAIVENLAVAIDKAQKEAAAARPVTPLVAGQLGDLNGKIPDVLVGKLDQDRGSGLSHRQGSAYLLASPSPKGPVIHRLDVSRADRAAGVHKKLAAAFAEKAQQNRAGITYFEITLDGSATSADQLEIAKELGYTLPGGALVTDKTVAKFQGQTVILSVATWDLSKNAGARLAKGDVSILEPQDSVFFAKLLLSQGLPGYSVGSMDRMLRLYQKYPAARDRMTVAQAPNPKLEQFLRQALGDKNMQDARLLTEILDSPEWKEALRFEQGDDVGKRFGQIKIDLMRRERSRYAHLAFFLNRTSQAEYVDLDKALTELGRLREELVSLRAELGETAEYKAFLNELAGREREIQAERSKYDNAADALAAYGREGAEGPARLNQIVEALSGRTSPARTGPFSLTAEGVIDNALRANGLDKMNEKGAAGELLKRLEPLNREFQKEPLARRQVVVVKAELSPADRREVENLSGQIVRGIRRAKYTSDEFQSYLKATREGQPILTGSPESGVQAIVEMVIEDKRIGGRSILANRALGDAILDEVGRSLGARLAATPNLDKLINRGVSSLFHATTPETVQEIIFKEHPEIPDYRTGHLDNRGKMGPNYQVGPRFASRSTAARHYAEQFGGLSLEFDIQKMKALGIDIKPFGEIEAMRPVPLSIMTDQSKQAVFRLVSERKGGSFNADEEKKLMQALGYENWDVMVSSLIGARMAEGKREGAERFLDKYGARLPARVLGRAQVPMDETVQEFVVNVFSNAIARNAFAAQTPLDTAGRAVLYDRVGNRVRGRAEDGEVVVREFEAVAPRAVRAEEVIRPAAVPAPVISAVSVGAVPGIADAKEAMDKKERIYRDVNRLSAGAARANFMNVAAQMVHVVNLDDYLENMPERYRVSPAEAEQYIASVRAGFQSFLLQRDKDRAEGRVTALTNTFVIFVGSEDVLSRFGLKSDEVGVPKDGAFFRYHGSAAVGTEKTDALIKQFFGELFGKAPEKVGYTPLDTSVQADYLNVMPVEGAMIFSTVISRLDLKQASILTLKEFLGRFWRVLVDPSAQWDQHLTLENLEALQKFDPNFKKYSLLAIRALARLDINEFVKYAKMAVAAIGAAA